MKRRAFLIGSGLGASLVGAASWLPFSPVRIGSARASTDNEHADADVMIAKIATARAALKTLVGPFTQERTIGLLSSKVRSNGELTLVRPDKLRWELYAPDDVTYWVLPEGLSYKSRSGKGHIPKVSPKLAAALDDLRTLLAGDLGSLRARYTLRLVKSDGQEVVFEAAPHAVTANEPRARLQSITFALASDLVRPLRTTIVEGPRDRTEIVFGNLARDVPVDAARMRP